MKRMKQILMFAGLLLSITSCTTNFDEINTNPNKITVGKIKAQSMFEPILYNGANVWQNYTWFWNNELIQFTAFTGGTTRQEHRYFISDANWQSVWNTYAGYANNSMHMYELAETQNEPALQAIALTFKVLFLSNLTDMYGDIPYSQAFTATKVDGTTKPVFDSQQSVYEQMFQDLEKANQLLAANPVFPLPALDGMYAGDVQKWRKFNNSLYLRLLCRVNGRPVMNVGVKMTELLSDHAKYPIFESNSDNATVNYSGLDPYYNYFFETTESGFSGSGRKLTQQLLKMTVETDAAGLQTYLDPRLPIIGKKNPNVSVNPKNSWIGTVAGCSEEQRQMVDRGSSWLNAKVFCRPAAPSTFMDYAELQFILAEAALKGLISGGASDAKLYYEEGVKASIGKWSAFGSLCETPVVVTSTDVNVFLASNLASWDKAADKAKIIAEQKYLALFWVGMEAYHEYRRTGYPELTIGAGAVYNDLILPTRFSYPATTMATNGDHAQGALTRMGGENTMKTPVWWSKQAIEAGN